MKLTRVLIPTVVALAFAVPVQGQDGFALKGHYLYNEAAGDVMEETGDLPDASSFSVGLEYVLPMGIGVGISGYTSGGADEFDVESDAFVVLAEANYFLRLPILPVSPYAGVHAGLGTYTTEALIGADPELDDTRTQFGYQAGVRLQLTPMIGLDGQYRRVSVSAAEDQDEGLDRNQYLIGITLF